MKSTYLNAWQFGNVKSEAKWIFRIYKRTGGDLQLWRREILISPSQESFLLSVAIDGFTDNTQHVRDAVRFRRQVLACFDRLVAEDETKKARRAQGITPILAASLNPSEESAPAMA